MAKITSHTPSKEPKHIMRNETLIEIPRVHATRAHTPVNNHQGSRCLLWLIITFSACSLTIMGVRTVGNLKQRVDDMAKRIDVLRAEKAYLEALVKDKINKTQFLAKIYSNQDILSYIDQEPEPFTDGWSFNINVVRTSDYGTYCNMYWLSTHIANRIYDKIIEVPTVIQVVKNMEKEEDNRILEKINDDISVENEILKVSSESEENNSLEEFSDEYEIVDAEDIYNGVIPTYGDETIAESVEEFIVTSVKDNLPGSKDDIITGANEEDSPYNVSLLLNPIPHGRADSATLSYFLL